ncbi:macrocin O-methyltransferase [Phragmitibacter flavus]|uniref:Macrocin O-methyltransferase n=2 Tax=Phragmitibacter flavus TaxID=2576071 RepID=A0A5R8K800_9BACT|nr:macrocin O-methyltransferase [Phragmitibacter flavus]
MRETYLQLMKNILLNKIYGQVEIRPVIGANPVNRLVAKAVKSAGLLLVKEIHVGPNGRDVGLDWPATAHTMIGMKRLDNVQFCIEDVIVKGVPGDVIETGVWRGGATILMRAVLKAWGVTDRKVWVADSFEGLPAPDEEKYPADRGDRFHTFEQLKVSLEQVQANFRSYDLLDDQVKFLKGWFSETLPHAPIERLAVMRLDGDMYESTMDALVSLYPKLSVGGYVIIDDYEAVPACKQAVHDYRAKHGIEDEIITIDPQSSYWRRSA